jgi:GT2 family glycosyltransferase
VVSRAVSRAALLRSQSSLNPHVTVLVPVFNREHLVGDAIRSVLEQDFEDLELLLVDDGSTDRTREVLERWKARDPRVVVVGSSENLGLPGAMNLGLAHARGTYLARLDSDDLIVRGRLAAQAAVLDAQPDVSLVSCAYDITDVDGKLLDHWSRPYEPEVTAFILPFFNVVAGGGQVMFRLAEVREMGGYSLDCPICEDYDLWVRLSQRGRVVTLPSVGMIKRRHGTQSIPRLDALRPAIWTRITRSSLGPYLGREIRDEEITAIFAGWRMTGTTGQAAQADRILREALTRFRRETPELESSVRKAIAAQWYRVARNFVRRRHPLEALHYLARGALWLVSRR